MRRLVLFFVFCLIVILSSSLCFAQTAKIIKVQGLVLVKKAAVPTWYKARVDMFLNKDAEIKTEKNSECTLTFDEEMKNILTIKENSHIKLESVIPSKIYLPEGRVFALIDELAKIEKFEIRTPTAIAGSRGTGLGTQYLGLKTTAGCFEDTVYIQGLDAKGMATGEKYLPAGYGVDVGSGGEIGGLFELRMADLEEWEGAKGDIEGLRAGIEAGAENEEETGNLQESTEEGREGIRDQVLEEGRREGEITGEEEKEEPPPPLGNSPPLE